MEKSKTYSLVNCVQANISEWCITAVKCQFRLLKTFLWRDNYSHHDNTTSCYTLHNRFHTIFLGCSNTLNMSSEIHSFPVY